MALAQLCSLRLQAFDELTRMRRVLAHVLELGRTPELQVFINWLGHATALALCLAALLVARGRALVAG